MYALLLLVLAASASAAETDALAISETIQARHTPYGAVLDPVFVDPDSDEISHYTRCGDSALWTGHYLAAEAFRYKVTGSEDALANVRKTEEQRLGSPCTCSEVLPTAREVPGAALVGRGAN